MTNYGILIKNGDGGISYLTTSIQPLREIIPHNGLFIKIGVGGYKLSDHFYSAPSQNYVPLWYICLDWGWGPQII